MAAKTPTITVDMTTAKALLDLFENVTIADVHFRTCQSDSFRTHVRAVAESPIVSSAFSKLKAAIDASSGDSGG